MDTEARMKALAEYLEVDADDLSEGYHDTVVEHGSSQYLVLTDEEADQQAADYIRETVWAFVPAFLASYVPDGIYAEHIDAMRGDQCEGFNDAAVALVKAGRGMDELIKGAIGADGRGHFLATYDGIEREQRRYPFDCGGLEFLYIYRIN